MPKARVISAFAYAALLVPVGAIVAAPKEILDGLAARGDVDPHPEAVAYAESVEAQEINIEAPAAEKGGDEKPDDPAALMAELSALKKDELVAYAKEKFDLDLDGAMKKDDMVAAIMDSAKVATK